MKLLRFESSVKEKDHQTRVTDFSPLPVFESSVKEKDHQTVITTAAIATVFESSVKEKDHQTERIGTTRQQIV